MYTHLSTDVETIFTFDILKLSLLYVLLLFQGCDDFTHNFLRKLGVRIRNPENIPTDPYTDHRKKVCF